MVPRRAALCTLLAVCSTVFLPYSASAMLPADVRQGLEAEGDLGATIFSGGGNPAFNFRVALAYGFLLPWVATRRAHEYTAIFGDFRESRLSHSQQDFFHVGVRQPILKRGWGALALEAGGAGSRFSADGVTSTNWSGFGGLRFSHECEDGWERDSDFDYDGEDCGIFDFDIGVDRRITRDLDWTATYGFLHPRVDGSFDHFLDVGIRYTVG